MCVLLQFRFMYYYSFKLMTSVKVNFLICKMVLMLCDLEMKSGQLILLVNKAMFVRFYLVSESFRSILKRTSQSLFPESWT